MNYFELVNKCLLELNYREVNSFSELIKNDHKKILNILNVINREICSLENWNFLLRNKKIELPAGISKIDAPKNCRILYFIIDGKEYTFQEDIKPFILGKTTGLKYSICADKILIPKTKSEQIADIYYYTQNCALSSTDEEKTEMTEPEDTPLIPMPFAEQLLVYGTCLRLKANPSYIRFSYWMSMYKEALLNLKSKSSIFANDAPKIKLYRY